MIAGDAEPGHPCSGSCPSSTRATSTHAVARSRAEGTAGSLLDELAVDGADLLAEVVDAIATGTATHAAEGEPTFAPKLGIDDARLDWAAPADAVATGSGA